VEIPLLSQISNPRTGGFLAFVRKGNAMAASIRIHLSRVRIFSLLLVCRFLLTDLKRLFGIVLIRQRGWAHFLFATLMAHHADQVRAAEFHIVLFAKLVQLP
jgi:hypothetical protein